MMLWVLLTLLGGLRAQTEATLTQPPLIETNTYTLRKTNASITSPTTTIAYMQTYTDAPQVFLSLVNMQSFTAASVVSYSMSVRTITTSSFIVRYVIACVSGGVSCSFSEIVVDYLVFDFESYSFVQIVTDCFVLDATALTTHQFYEVNYMDKLYHGHSYSLTVMLAGVSGMALAASAPELYINAIENSRKSYYLEVRFKNAVLLGFDYVRVLIDETMMAAANTGPSSLSCSSGTIVHYSDPKAIEHNPTPDFLPFAVFFGVSGFAGWSISLSSLTYIFNNTTPRLQANIGYVLFLTASCPSSQLYVSSENLCYGLSSAFYYQATPATMMPCPYSCYQCVGPLTTQCRSCVQGWNRVLSSGRCLCISGFYDPGAPQCKNCTEAIAGCKTCSSATNCLTCLAGCTAIGFSPIYCDCPNNVQTNFSYNCPANYYFDYSANDCSCLPQTYLSANAHLCFPCAPGCYICAGSATHCLACIDAYSLINNTCIYFYVSYALLGQKTNYNDPKLRCLRWDQSTGSCSQRCKYYYYQGNCYSKCPGGSFNISFPWLTCQPCQKSCNLCFNFTICYQCAASYFYFNTSILSCSPCTAHCQTCSNASHCAKCDPHYQLVDNAACLLPAIPAADCGENCSYCLISHQCLQCRIPYMLNQSAQACIDCSAQAGLRLQADGCHEICGDGNILNHECDDGNSNSGDGCSSDCQVESGFQCRRVSGVSRCWSRDIALEWQIYVVFGTNKAILSFYSQYPLRSAAIDLHCGFQSQLVSRQTVGLREELTIAYEESVITMAETVPSSPSSANASKNYCRATFNQLQNITFPINAEPTFFCVDYSSTLQSVSNGEAMRTATTISVYFTLGTMILGVSPMTSYACSRFLGLFLVTFTEYMHVPINSFGSYESLQALLFVSPSHTTRQLTSFSSEYYTGVLWHLAVVYMAFVVWLEVVVGFVGRVSRSMEWGLLARMAAMVAENRQVAYQNMYITYEVVIYCLLAKVFQNAGAASPLLTFLAALHCCFVVLSKIHFYFTFSALERGYPQFTHMMTVEQVQNICIGFASAATIPKMAYTPLLMILFAVYPLLSLGRNSSTPPKEDGFHITLQMTMWQLRVSCVLQACVQALKLAFMWCGHLLVEEEEYEAVGTALGVCIGLLVSLLVVLGALNSLLVHLIRVCEARNQAKSIIPSHENLDLQTVDASSHAD